MNAPNYAESAEQEKSARRKLFWKSILYFCLLVAVVFAAWQAYIFFTAGGDANRPSVPGDTGAVGGDSTSQTPSSMAIEGLLESAENPATAARNNLKQMEGDPAKIPPPLRAVKQAAFSRIVGGHLYQHASYLCPASKTSTREHYRQIARDMGFYSPPAGDRKASPDKDIFIRNDDGGTVLLILRLRNCPTLEKIIRIEFMAVRPAE